MRHAARVYALAALLVLLPLARLEAVSQEGSTGPVPKLLQAKNHAHHHNTTVHKHNDGKRPMSCGGPTYTEYLYFSDATHTTVVGWRIYGCHGTHSSGSTSPYCDWMIECCAGGIIDSGTCE